MSETNIDFNLEMPADPIVLFQQWFEEAKKSEPAQANAFALATVRPDGRPDTRMMFMRELKDGYLRFNCGIDSPKGKAIAHQPYVAAVFHWKSANRQVRIAGTTERIEDSLADAEFSKRPRLHKLGVWASKESQPLESTEILRERLEKFDAQFGEEVPRPASWTGYRLLPLEIQFWTAVPHGLHERIGCFRSHAKDAWSITRLNP